MGLKLGLLAGLALPALMGAAQASNGVFALGEVTVQAQKNQHTAKPATVIDQATLRAFNRETLDKALTLVPGVTISDVGPRNESDIWVRGFDRWRVPMYQDGIPVYLPVDDRVDFGRFTTADIAEIQVAKGWASVIDGPGAMGGAINIVSREVQKPLEADLRVGMNGDNAGGLAGEMADGFVGTRQQNWYAQAAISFNHQDHTRLSDDFKPGTFQAAGNRIESKAQDYKLNFKIGITPNSSDEYAINVIDQVGDKGNPPPDGVIPVASQKSVKYWTWPAWDKQSVYFLSKTALGPDQSFLKTRIYYDRFYNALDSYDSIAYATQNTPKSFNSIYDDHAAGVIGEYDLSMLDGADVLRFSSHLRADSHTETEQTRNIPFGKSYWEPWEPANEITYSEALENIYHVTPVWDVTLGGSYDTRVMVGDRQWVSTNNVAPFGYSYNYPVSNKSGLNGEASTSYHYSASGSVFASFADRIRFPTLFEMYSTRFGTFVNNPNLQPERSYYFEAGVSDEIMGTKLGADVYHARVLHAIDAVGITPTVSENENIGTELHDGYEITLSRHLLRNLELGGDFAYLDRENKSGTAIATDTPRDTMMIWANWQPIDGLSVRPNLQMASNRVLQSAVNSLVYYHGGAYTLAGFKISYQLNEKMEIEAGMTNIADVNYVLADGYNAPGRGYFANLRYTY